MTTLGQSKVAIPARQPGDPVITTAKFQTVRKVSFERVAGCHEVLRKRATSKFNIISTGQDVQ